jgi:penicillin-binding protein 2
MPRNRRPRGPSAELRIYFMALLILLGFCGLVAKLWWEQVARGSDWTKKIANRSEVTVRIPSVRGEIRDRKGVTLVGNRASYEVDFYLLDMVRGYKNQHGYVPTTTHLAPVRQMLKEKREADVVQIVNTGIIPRLQDLDLAKDYNAERLQKHYRNDTLVPFTYLEEIDFKTIAKFAEHNVGLPGVDISVRPVRQYVYGALAAHLLGYVGAPLNIDQQPDVDKFTFYQPDVEGKSQIEFSMDKYLRGKPGVRVLQKNVKGVIESEVRTDPPQPGNNVYLTLDAHVQMVVEQALRHPQLGRAAAVVIDPNTGDILGMGSVPSFDPNMFIPSISEKDWDVLNKDEAVPLVNRAVSGFPPGSTFKIITALAGLKKGIGNKGYNCSGSVDYGGRPFHCWIAEKHGSHGTLGLTDALKVSCDCFFYQYGNEAKIETIDYFGSMLGLGKRHDLGLSDEKEGCMPDPNWLRIRFPQEKWSTAHTANVSIGQGYVLASPLQMAMAYATVANGGTVYEPRLVKAVLDAKGRPVRVDAHGEVINLDDPNLVDKGTVAVPDEPKVHADLRRELTADQIEKVREGLRKVVMESGGAGGGGTGAKARIKGIVVAGKSGTAQATDRGKKDTIAWFCEFAPYDKPRYVVCAMVQGGHHGGSVAAPVTSHIMEQLISMDQGNLTVELTKLDGARSKNPFLGIEALTDYKNADSVKVDAEEESATFKPGGEKVQMGGGTARPDIRPEADARGKLKERAPQPPPVDRRSFFQRFFGPRQPAPAPAPAPRPNPFMRPR